MATRLREESGNLCDGGLGAGGKFRKRPFRRPQTTPYDRPPTVSRNAGTGNRNIAAVAGGWLFKLVDPAQRLITHSANKFLASVFPKRLPLHAGAAPPLQPWESETNQEMEDVDHQVGSALPVKNNMAVKVGDVGASQAPSNITNKDGFTELEQILGQKTFTRSEIDRLTTLLRANSVDASMGKEEHKNEMLNLKSLASHDIDEEVTCNLDRENGGQSYLASTPYVSTGVLDEGIASPAELAKAYMGSRPSEISPSMPGLCSQVFREDSLLLCNKTPIPPKSTPTSLVPRSSGQVGRPENGFITPRFRGRSAVYNMARTPYSRLHSNVKLGPFLQSSQGAWEERIVSGSKQGAQMGVKRRSSVLDSDIGSVGSVRRIRQKSNLCSARGLSMSAFENSLLIHASSTGFDSQHASSSKQVVKPNFASTSQGSIDNRSSGSSFNAVPSKSRETASKILQQLDKLVSTRYKSPTKLSLSMLKGPALKSLQNVDSSKFLEKLQDNKLTGSPGALLTDNHESSLQKQNKPEVGGPSNCLALPSKPVTSLNSLDSTVIKMDHAAGAKGAVLPVMISLEHPPPPKKRAFRMSAREEYLELDNDNVAASTSVLEDTEKADASKLDGSILITETGKAGRPLSFSEVKPSAIIVPNKNGFLGTCNGAMDTGKSSDATSTSSGSMTVQSAGFVPESIKNFDRADASEQSNTFTDLFSTGEKVPSQKEPIDAPALFANSSSLLAAAILLEGNSRASACVKVEKPSSNSTSEVPESNKNVDINTSEAGLITSTGSSPTGSMFSSGATAAIWSPNNSSLVTGPSVFPMISNVSSNSLVGQSPVSTSTQPFAASPSTTSLLANFSTSSNSSSNSSSMLQSASTLSYFSTTAPIFKFGGSPALASVSTVSISAAPDSKEANTKESTSGNLVSVPFGGTTSILASTGTGIFSGTSSAISSLPHPVFGDSSSAVFNTGSNILVGTSSTVGSTANVASSGSSSTDGSTERSIFGSILPTTSGTGTSIFSGTSASTTVNGIFGASSPALTSTGSNLFGGTAASTGSSLFGGTAASTGSGLFGSTTASTGSSIFGFSAGATSSASSQALVVNSQTAITGTRIPASAQSISFQFGSSTSSPSFGLAASSSSPSGSSTSGSLFGSSASSQLGFSPSLENSIRSSSTSTSSVFGSNWETTKSTSKFDFSINSSCSTLGLSFGASSGSATASGTSTLLFGSSAPTSSSSIFNFSSAPATTPSQPVFGNSSLGFAFGTNTVPSTNGNSNDQMSMEDSMAEDTYQSKASTVAMFGQQPAVAPQPNFAFGVAAASAPSSGTNPFQFGSQPNTTASQNLPPFHASDSLEFNGGGPGGSFSLGSADGDKSKRRIVKVNRNRRTKK